MSVTQKDVADQLGISQRAVAFALSGSPEARKQVSAETRQRVLTAVEQLGYRPHRYAQMMRKGKSNLIGMIQSRSLIQALVERSHFASKAIRDAGCQCVSHDISWPSDEVRSACDAMIDARVEGVLLAGPESFFPQTEIQRLQDAGIAVASFISQKFSGVPRVLADNRQGMKELMQHLVRLGHRRLALIVCEPAKSTDPCRCDSVYERVAGFRDTVAAAGLTHAEVVYQPMVDQPASRGLDDAYEPGRLAAMRLLARKRRPQVLLCSNDYWAIGALKACADMAVRVPQDIAITGFDNTGIGQYTSAMLTTVEQPIEAMATKAVKLLLAMVQGGSLAPDQELVTMPCRLVIRQSCGALLPLTKA